MSIFLNKMNSKFILYNLLFFFIFLLTYELFKFQHMNFIYVFLVFFLVGQGAYGVVVAAKDHSSTDVNSKLVAIKKIEKAFEHKIFTKRTLRELKILRLLKHENVKA